MSDSKGPITIIQDLSERSNRWKALAFAWRSAAISSIRPCAACGSPSLWVIPETGVYWCQVHRDSAPGTVASKAQKVAWFNGLQRALELEDQLEEAG